MSATTISANPGYDRAAASTLKAAATMWFVVAVAGQAMFAFYIATVYGLAALQGDPAAWQRVLPPGFGPGAPALGAALAIHLLFAAAITLSGGVQLLPGIRAWLPKLHCWNGRFYIVAAFIMGTTALLMVLSGRMAFGDQSQWGAGALNALFILVFASLALRYALARDFAAHRRWALRLFLVVSGVWFFRVGLMLSALVFGGPVGYDPRTFIGPFLTGLTLGQTLFPLAVLELYFWAQRSPGAMRQFATAAVLVTLTLAMGGGIAGATGAMWLPKIRHALDGRQSIEQVLTATIATDGIDAAVAQYHALKALPDGHTNFDEDELNHLGYALVNQHRMAEAIRVLTLNVDAYPQSANTYDSLAEAYLDDGNKPLAIEYYQKALDHDPAKRSASLALAELQAH